MWKLENRWFFFVSHCLSSLGRGLPSSRYLSEGRRILPLQIKRGASLYFIISFSLETFPIFPAFSASFDSTLMHSFLTIFCFFSLISVLFCRFLYLFWISVIFVLFSCFGFLLLFSHLISSFLHLFWFVLYLTVLYLFSQPCDKHSVRRSSPFLSSS